MQTSRFYTIKAKLTLIVLLASFAAVLLAGAIFSVYDYLNSHQDLKEDLTILAEVIGNRSTAALQFDDRNLARQNLDALRVRKSVLAAAIYQADNHLFATYLRPGHQEILSDLPPAEQRPDFTGEHLHIYVPIRVDGEILGTVYMKSDLLRIGERLRLFALVLLFTLLASLSLALVLTGRLQGVLVAPIKHLIRTAQRISESKDYAIRAERYGEDELGQLTQSFNDMLAQIEQRENALRRSEAKYRSIYENASDGIFQALRNGQLITANPAMARILGYDSVDDLLTCFRGIERHGYIEEDLGRLRQAFQDQAQVKDLELQIRRKEGKTVHIALTAQQILDERGCFSHYEGRIVDISGRIEKEKVERELSQAEMANRAKSEFLANMSHEIRTPMNAIIGMAHLALRSGLPGKSRSYVEKLEQAAHSLLRILNDILDFSKIEAGQLAFENIDFQLDSVLDGVANIATLPAQSKGLELIFDIAPDVPETLRGDPLRLGQILNNLLNNAVKFTERGEIILSVRRLHPPPNLPAGQALLHFSIKDSGIGLSRQEQNKIFTAFSQADSSTTRKFGGTGLGLVISKRLVEMMGGEIGVDSSPGEGSTFHFQVPLSLQPTPLPAHRQRHPQRLLIITANTTMRSLLVRMLREQGFGADSAADIPAALEALSRQHLTGSPHALVLLDTHPAAEDFAELRQLQSFPAMPPIALLTTTYWQDTLVQQLAQAHLHVAAYFAKPLTPKQLQTQLHKLFSTATPSEPSPPPRENQEHSLAGARILLVDDNELNRELAEEFLREAGALVENACNGAHALDRLAAGNFDLVLMDCQMPVMDGFEATRRIRSHPRHRHLPVIAMTANALDSDRRECLAAGMNDHIAKPLEINRFLATIRHWLSATRKGPDFPPDAQTDKREANPASQLRAAHQQGQRELVWQIAISAGEKARASGARRLAEIARLLERAMQNPPHPGEDGLVVEFERLQNGAAQESSGD